MSPPPDSTLDDPRQIIADLRHALAERTAERDEASRRLDERTAERDEALEQQTATAEVLQVINSSPGDLAPVFDAMMEKATALCEAVYGHLWTFDGKHFHPRSVHGEPSFGEWVFRRGAVLPTPGSPFDCLVRGERFVQIADATQDDLYRSGSGFRDLVEISGSRTQLAVALLKDDQVIGAIVVYRQEVRPFSDKQIALLQNFAAQAVIAMENARLITEAREALEQQTATAEVLQVINASPGDLAPVFDALLEKATQVCDAAFGVMNTYDGEGFHTAAVHRLPPALAETYRRDPPPPGPHSPLTLIAQGKDVVSIDDLAVGPGADLPRRRILIEQGRARSWVAVALRKDGTLLGAISAYRTEVRPFSDKQIALLQNFAAQAVIAMENARLLTETREALEQQTATAEVLQVINSSPGDLAPVFDAILEKAMRLCGFDHGSLQTYDGQLFHAVAVRGLPEQLAEQLRRGYRPELWPPTRPLVDGARLVHIHDLTQEEQVEGVRLAVASGSRTLLFIPLRKDNALLGMIVAVRQQVRPFSDKQIALLQNFAAQAVIAMENARLITETREALEQQTATAEVLQVINSSPGDLTPVFEAILEKAHSLCGVASGALQLYDGEKFRAVATNGLPETLAEWLRDGWPPGSSQQRVVAGEADVIHIADLVASDSPRARYVAEIGGVRTLLYVALRKDQKLLGVISASRFEVRPFSEKEIALLQNFAAQAVIAIENARLITETQQRTAELRLSLEYQTAISNVLNVISRSTFDLTPVLDFVLETAMRLCGNDSAEIFRLEDGAYQYAISRGMNEEQIAIEKKSAILPGPETVVGRAALSGQPVQIIDAWSDPDYRPKEEARLGGWRTMLAVPLLREGTGIGVISMARSTVDAFTDKQIELVRTFADQAVIAIENARLLSELRQRTDEVAELNRGLEARVAEQVDELGRVGRLKRFLAPQLAELIVSQGDENILESHRREIVVVFCDLRGYTAFTETAEPEEVLDFLREYHGALGPLVSQFEGTLDQFSGDGIMVFFNDPVPIPDPAERAVKMAVAMRDAASALIVDWRERGRDLGFGAGIAQGYATLGQIGFADRSGYTAIGTVCNVAARLCAEAKDGQILLGQRVNVALKGSVATEQLGPLTLKGLSQPVVAYNVPLGAVQAAFRVIEGGSPQTV